MNKDDIVLRTVGIAIAICFGAMISQVYIIADDVKKLTEAFQSETAGLSSDISNLSMTYHPFVDGEDHTGAFIFTCKPVDDDDHTTLNCLVRIPQLDAPLSNTNNSPPPSPSDPNHKTSL